MRRVRGLVVGLVGSAVAVTGHVLAGGSALGPAVIAALLLVLAGCVVASGRRWTPPRLLVALVAAQPAVHGVLWLSSPTGSTDPRLMATGTGSLLAGHPGHGGAGIDLQMVVAHAAAVAVAALILLALEGLALSLWTLLHTAVLVTRGAVVPVLARLAVAVRSCARAADGLVVVARRPRRGPPMFPAPC
jgi:hypothetical protein